MANEIPRIERWITWALSNDVQLASIVGSRIYSDQAPEHAAYPFVVFSHQAGEDANGVGTCRVLTRNLYQIAVWMRDRHDDNSRLAADRIDEVISKAVRAQHPSDPSFVFSGRRESPLPITEPERDSSRVFRRLGGLYWITASAA
jgi:hypothetical protein